MFRTELCLWAVGVLTLVAAVGKAWNVVEGSQFYDGPTGIHVGPETEHLILRHNAVFPHGEKLRDESGGHGYLAPAE
jgi:hypothetical protein